jgi:hypothetical protein
MKSPDINKEINSNEIKNCKPPSFEFFNIVINWKY